MRRTALAAAALAITCMPLAWLARAASPQTVTERVQGNYMLHCMGCHLADGSGAPGKVPSLRESLGVLAASSAGRRYLVQVPGAAQSRLSDLELAQVLSWMVRHLSAPSMPPGFADFTAAEVARYRRSPLIDVRAARAGLLQESVGPLSPRAGRRD